MRAPLFVLFAVLGMALARAELYPSPEALVGSLKKYDFAADREGLTPLLTIEEPRQPSLSARMVTPQTVEDAQILWKSDQNVLAWITARPATDSVPTETGALLLLRRNSGSEWYIASKIPFSAVGKYADIRFKFTGGDHSPPPIITVTTSNGGRGASYQASATYELHADRLFRKDLHR